MFKFFKENRKTLIFFLIIAILFPIIILSPSPIGKISYETGLTIVGYGGSILGGFLTLYGVWWTIEDNKKQKTDELRRLYRPLLTTDTDFIRVIPGSLQIINFKNNGRGEFYIDNVETSNKSVRFIKNYNPITILQVDQSTEWNLIFDSDVYPNKIKQGELIKITVSGRNFLDDNIYAVFEYKCNYIQNNSNNVNILTLEIISIKNNIT